MEWYLYTTRVVLICYNTSPLKPNLPTRDDYDSLPLAIDMFGIGRSNAMGCLSVLHQTILEDGLA